MGPRYSVARGLLWNLTAAVARQFWNVWLIGSFLLAECMERNLPEVLGHVNTQGNRNMQKGAKVVVKMTRGICLNQTIKAIMAS